MTAGCDILHQPLSARRLIGERIPSALWTGAVAATVEHGAFRWAAELHLGLRAVRKRRAALAGGTTPASGLAPRFVELFAPAGRENSATSHEQCVVELNNARGAKMRVKPWSTARTAAAS